MSPFSHFNYIFYIQCLVTLCPLCPHVKAAFFFLGPSVTSWSFTCPLWKTTSLTSTSPVRSLYLSRMTGRAGFSLRVLERSLKGCSKAGEGEERLISLSPRLKLLLCDPGRSGGTVKGFDYSA